MRMGWVFAIGVLIAGCAPTAAQDRNASRAALPTEQVEQPQVVTVEFEPPEGFTARTSDGVFVQQAAQVGFFGTALEPLRTMRIPREQIRVQGRTAQVSVPLQPIDGVTEGVTLRVRMLGLGRPGKWSEAVGPVTLPTAPARAAATPRRARATGAGARERAGAQEILARRPALALALKENLSADYSSAQALAAFPTVGDLATAIILVRSQGVTLQALGQKVAGPPAKDLAAALAELRPQADAPATIRAARKEARSLLAPARRGGAASP